LLHYKPEQGLKHVVFLIVYGPTKVVP
jgi:hypothetical protein